MPSPPRTVLDGLEGLWDGAARGWRETNRLREEAEAAKARARRQIVQAASKSVQQAASGVKAGVDKAMARAGETRPGKVVDALFGTTEPPIRSGRGIVDRAEVDRRRAQTKAELGAGLDSAIRSGVPEAAAGVWPAAGVNWYQRVKPNGSWDDRGRAELANAERPPSQRVDPNGLEYQGNFSNGATAEMLGAPKNLALFAGGAVQRLSNVGRALDGDRLKASVGHFYPPYGDDPYDQRAISEGHDYGRQASVRGR